MDYSRKQLPPAPQPTRQPRQSALQRITGWLLFLSVSGVIAVLLSEIALRLRGIRTPQSIFVISHAASLWSYVVALPWGDWLDVPLHLMAYSALGMFFVIGIVFLKDFSIETGHGGAVFFIVASGLGVLACNLSDEKAGLTELLGWPFVLLVIVFAFDVLWLNPTIVADDPTLEGKMKPNLWVYVFLLEGFLVFEIIGSHDNIFDDWWLLGKWIFWLAVAALSCFEAIGFWEIGKEIRAAFRNSELYAAIRRFLIWVSRPWIAPPVKYPPFKPPAHFGTGGRLSSDPLDDQVMATGLVNDNDPENAPSMEYKERKTTIIDERKTLRLK